MSDVSNLKIADYVRSHADELDFEGHRTLMEHQIFETGIITGPNYPGDSIYASGVRGNGSIRTFVNEKFEKISRVGDITIYQEIQEKI